MATNKKISQSKRKKATKKQGYTFTFARKELFLWVGVAFLALTWMFTLGVIVGRGLSPVRFDMEKLKKELIALKERAAKRSAASATLEGQTGPDARHLGFYDVLTDKKEEARMKSLPRPARTTAGKAQKGIPPNKSDSGSQTKPRIKTAVVKKYRRLETPVDSKKKNEQRTYTLQVASLKDPVKAQNMVATLKQKGYGAYAVSASVSGKGTYHRVRVGHFTDRGDATRTASRLRRESLEPIIMRE